MKNNSGVSLIEVLLAVAITSILLSLVGIFFTFFFDNYDFVIEQSNSINRARLTLQQMAREVKEAQRSEEGAYPLVTANDQEITFFSDADDDGVVERVRYYLDSESMYRGLIEPVEGNDPLYDPATEQVSEVVNSVSNGSQPIFFYYNSDWPADTTNNPLVLSERLLNAQLVEIEININTDQSSIENVTVSTQVMIRNLKTDF